MKDFKQTKENKEKFNCVLIEPLLEKNCTKQELKDNFNFLDRRLREKISEISMFYPVIAHSRKKGYRISNIERLLNENSVDHIKSEIEEIKVCLHEINSRIKFLKKRQKPLIAALKVLEKRINNER